MRRRVEVGFVTVVMADFLSVCWQQLQQAAARLNGSVRSWAVVQRCSVGSNDETSTGPTASPNPEGAGGEFRAAATTLFSAGRARQRLSHASGLSKKADHITDILAHRYRLLVFAKSV
jgi:hypothetical protein